MPYCSNCRAYISDDEDVCPNCGNINKRHNNHNINTQVNNRTRGRGSFKNFLLKLFKTCDYTYEYSDVEIKTNRNFSIFAYLGPLCLLTLLLGRKSKYARFHFFQGLMNTLVLIILLLLIDLVANPIIKALGFFGAIIIFVLLGVAIISLTFYILGLINVIKNKARTLPLWGNLKLFKKFYK